jgi:predicted Zn-dependent peptidase
MYKHKIITLKNGLRLITVPMPQVGSVTVIVLIGAGSRHEAKRVSGLFHFIEHMAFKGTKTRSSTLDIATEVDNVGGEFNAFTGKERTGYFIKLAAKHQELAFDILSDMIQNSLFKTEEIERERGVIIEEINMYEDTPTRRVWENFIRLIYIIFFNSKNQERRLQKQSK